MQEILRSGFGGRRTSEQGGRSKWISALPDPVRLRDRELYLARADQARKEADDSPLTNVRERCLRAEAAWRAMAEKIEHTESMRMTQLKIKNAGE